jgi:hypothetical protein
MFLTVSSQHEEVEQKDNRLEPEDEGLDPNILVESRKRLEALAVSSHSHEFVIFAFREF